jgi:hypothetical protein
MTAQKQALPVGRVVHNVPHSAGFTYPYLCFKWPFTSGFFTINKDFLFPRSTYLGHRSLDFTALITMTDLSNTMNFSL